MLSRAVSRYVKYSPYKLRLLINVVRGMRLDRALQWLIANRSKRTVAINKVLMSAWANAKVKTPNLEKYSDVFVSLAKVDQGPVAKYSLPGAQGRSVLRRRRTCHIEVQLEKAKTSMESQIKEAHGGSQG